MRQLHRLRLASALRLYAPMDILTMRPMTALRMDTMGRTGSQAESSSALARGSLVRMAFMATWIIATIHVTDTMARCRNVIHMRLRTFRAMKPGMGVAMWVMLDMSPQTNTAPDLQAGDIPVVDTRAADIPGKLMEGNQRPALQSGPFILLIGTAQLSSVSRSL